MEIKEGDVFKFRYKEEYMSKLFYPYHCFDGQLVAQEDKNGGIILVDTYWSDLQTARKFTIEEALSRGTLEFKFNTNDVVQCSEYDSNYYKESDIFDFSYQHGCYKRFVRKKDATRDKDIMLMNLKERLASYEAEIKHTQMYMKHIKEQIDEIENGKDLNNIYIPSK